MFLYTTSARFTAQDSVETVLSLLLSRNGLLLKVDDDL